jgi:hypothetical protein
LCPEGQAALVLPVLLPVLLLVLVDGVLVDELLDDPPSDEPLDAGVVVVLPESELEEVLVESAFRLSVR